LVKEIKKSSLAKARLFFFLPYAKIFAATFVYFLGGQMEVRGGSGVGGGGGGGAARLARKSY
jgi:hypothetical protein